jgi:hypothetical protein
MFAVEWMWRGQIRMSLVSHAHELCHMDRGAGASLVRIATTVVLPYEVECRGRIAEIGGIRSLTARLVVAFLSWVVNGRQSTKARGLESEGLCLAPLPVRSRLSPQINRRLRSACM